MKPERKKQVGQTPGKWYFDSKIVLTYCEKKNILFGKNVLEKLEEQFTYKKIERSEHFQKHYNILTWNNSNDNWNK